MISLQRLDSLDYADTIEIIGAHWERRMHDDDGGHLLPISQIKIDLVPSDLAAHRAKDMAAGESSEDSESLPVGLKAIEPSS